MTCVHSSPGMAAPPKSTAAVTDAFSMRVAIVESDPTQAAVFSQWLKLAGHRCRHFPDSAGLLRAFDQLGLDALLLAWNPGTGGGPEVLRRIRHSDRASLPILLLGGQSREDDVVSALRQGADDYLAKPVRRLELLARLEAIARRGRHPVQTCVVIEAGGLRLDCETRTVWRDGRPLELTAKDFELSVLFLRNIGKLLSRGYLMDSVWGPDGHALSRTLDTHISRVRKKLGLTPEHGWRLMSLYSRGYRLDHLPGPERAYKADCTDRRPLPFSASSSPLAS
jgi:two-component system response regulator RegX3